jgi:hypothetical protein
MKVTITKESGSWMTVDELPYAKQIVKDMKDDEMSAQEYAKMAADAILWGPECGDSVKRVIEADAEITRDNAIPYEQFGEGCGRLGVWSRFTAETFDGFLKVGCLLADVWMLGTEEARQSLKNHSWIRYYTEQK